MKGSLIPVVCVLAVTFRVALASSAGPPDESGVCLDLTPGHGFTPQTTPTPFQVTASVTKYTPGQQIQVTLSTTDGGVFKGFILQARRATPGANQDERLGVFSSSDPAHRQSCVNNGGGTITHANPSSKSEAVVTWTAPAQFEGAIAFRASFVRTFTTYWVQVRSATLVPGDDMVTGGSTHPANTTQSASSTTPSVAISVTTSVTTITKPTTRTPGASRAPVDIDLSECARSRGCYRSPENCLLQECDYVVTWQAIEDGYVGFQMAAKLNAGQSYVALGFSANLLMENSSVVGCIDESGVVNVYMSYNAAGTRSNSPLNDPSLGLDLSSVGGGVTDGTITCEFNRMVALPPTPTRVDSDQFFDINNKFTLLVAKGPSSVAGTLSFHTSSPQISPQQVNVVTEVVNVGGSQSFPLVKAHASLMVFAWMFFASFGILMPRYCKDTWTEKTWCGKAIWFQLHQPCMILCLLCTVAGFIVIFIDVKGYSSGLGLPGSVHPPLGIIVTILVIVNPLMALGRPAPDHPKRPIFNGFHFTVGLLAHAASAAAIFIGVWYLGRAALPQWCRWVALAWIIWQAVIEIILAIHMHTVRNKQSNSNNVGLQDMGSVNGKSTTPINVTFGDPSKKSDKVVTGIVCVHAVVCLGLTLTLVVMLARG